MIVLRMVLGLAPVAAMSSISAWLAGAITSVRRRSPKRGRRYVSITCS